MVTLGDGINDGESVVGVSTAGIKPVFCILA